ncbi:MAG: CHASE2 domain-containing protein, partial [Chromatiaceae bacterium]|nr:CHASE2 domain-containing protein [Chromatiaceae bacterium]
MSHTLYVLLRTGLSLGLVLVLMLHASGYSPLPLLTQLELIAYDSRLRLTLPGDVDARIVIVDVDEASLAREGRWPWPRQRVANLVDTLFSHYQVRLVAFDMVFAEAQTDPTLIAVDRLAQGVLRDDAAFMQQWISLRPHLDDDTLLADSFRDRDVVTGYYFASYGQNSGDLNIGRLPAPAASLSALGSG